MAYEGNVLKCKFCKHYSMEKFNTDTQELYREPCKNIDHNVYQIRPNIFNGYEGAYSNGCICKYFEPKSCYRSITYKNIEEYIEFLRDNSPRYEFYRKKGIDSFKEFETKTIRIPSQDIEIGVPLLDWIMGTWKNEDIVKFKFIKYLGKRKNGEYYKIIKEIRTTCIVGYYNVANKKIFNEHDTTIRR